MHFAVADLHKWRSVDCWNHWIASEPQDPRSPWWSFQARRAWGNLWCDITDLRLVNFTELNTSQPLFNKPPQGLTTEKVKSYNLTECLPSLTVCEYYFSQPNTGFDHIQQWLPIFFLTPHLRLPQSESVKYWRTHWLLQPYDSTVCTLWFFGILPFFFNICIGNSYNSQCLGYTQNPEGLQPILQTTNIFDKKNWRWKIRTVT